MAVRHICLKISPSTSYAVYAVLYFDFTVLFLLKSHFVFMRISTCVSSTYVFPETVFEKYDLQ